MKLAVVAAICSAMIFRCEGVVLTGPQKVTLQKASRTVITGPAVSAMVRLAFHDCVGGCNGCLNVNNPDNAGLEYLVAALDANYKSYNISQLGLSRADFWSYSAIAAFNMSIENANKNGSCPTTNPYCVVPYPTGFMFKTGRKDCATAPYGGNETLPSANLDYKGVMNYFATQFGFNTSEVVALMGIHILGEAHVNASGFNGRWWLTTPNTLNNEFYKIIRNTTFGWRQTNISPPGTTPHNQWNGIVKPPGFMLNTDMALYRNVTLDSNGLSSCTCATCAPAPTWTDVHTYADNLTKWVTDFTAVFDKMLSFGSTGLEPTYVL